MKSRIIISVLVVMIFSQQKMVYCQRHEILDSTVILSVLQSGLENYLNKIPDGKEIDFGFNSKEEFNKILFGNPLQIYTISEDLSSDIYFSPTTIWKVPLIVDDSYRCFLDILLINGAYKVVGMGLNKLASDLDAYERHRHLKVINDRAIFIDYSLSAYFLVIKDASNNINFFPFRPMTFFNSNEFSNKEKYSSNEIFEMLKTINKKQ
jgi:hypothetical protein